MGSISHGGHERGKRGDGDLTRARILESAGQLAAECGYANMTSKQVCERAHVNMAAVNYHFGSREGLYAAVLAEAHDRLFTLERLRQILAEGTAREKLSRTLDELLAHLHGPRSWHVRVLAREFFSPAGFVDPAFANSLFPNLAEKSASLDQMVKDFIFAGLDDAAAKWRARSAGAGCGTGSDERR